MVGSKHVASLDTSYEIYGKTKIFTTVSANDLEKFVLIAIIWGLLWQHGKLCVCVL